MRGVDLNVFDFDYDLTWAAFFMNGYEKIYGRYGGRDASSADGYLTLSGLRHALREALAAHRREPRQADAAEKKQRRTVEQFAAAKKQTDVCIHCHQVYDFRRDDLRAAGKWQLDDVWVYPLPDNLGIVLDPVQGNLVKSVQAGSSAERSGLRPGDELTSVNGLSVASFADAQYALHRGPGRGRIPLAWRRRNEVLTADLDTPDGWRKTDISWRASMWGLQPPASVYGEDLMPDEKKALGLPAKSLAFRQGDFVPAPAKRAGIQAKDVIFGIDGKNLEMTMLQFNAYIRLNFKVGRRITFNVLRDGKRLDVPMTLPERE
jgi:predicted metalloprotease with PDZ domain